MTPLSFRSGVLEGGIGVRFPAGLKTLGVVGLLKGACFGMPLSGAAGRTVSGPGATTSRDGSSPATSAFPAFPSGAEAVCMLWGAGPLPPASTRCPVSPSGAEQACALGRPDSHLHEGGEGTSPRCHPPALRGRPTRARPWQAMTSQSTQDVFAKTTEQTPPRQPCAWHAAPLTCMRDARPPGPAPAHAEPPSLPQAWPYACQDVAGHTGVPHPHPRGPCQRLARRPGPHRGRPQGADTQTAGPT